MGPHLFWGIACCHYNLTCNFEIQSHLHSRFSLTCAANPLTESIGGINWREIKDNWLTNVMSFTNTVRAILPSPQGMGELYLFQLRCQHNFTTQLTAWWVNLPITDSYYPCSQVSTDQRTTMLWVSLFFCLIFVVVCYFSSVVCWVSMSLP